MLFTRYWLYKGVGGEKLLMMTAAIDSVFFSSEDSMFFVCILYQNIMSAFVFGEWWSCVVNFTP